MSSLITRIVKMEAELALLKKEVLPQKAKRKQPKKSRIQQIEKELEKKY